MYEKEFEYEIIYAKDIPEEKLENYFEQSVQFIDSSVKMGGKCLIHCFAGLFTIRYRLLLFSRHDFDIHTLLYWYGFVFVFLGLLGEENMVRG